jgi:hypothetical protein
MMCTVLNAIETHSEDSVMIGGDMYIDVIMGLESGLETILVLSGVTRREDVQLYSYAPPCSGLGCRYRVVGLRHSSGFPNRPPLKSWVNRGNPRSCATFRVALLIVCVVGNSVQRFSTATCSPREPTRTSASERVLRRSARTRRTPPTYRRTEPLHLGDIKNAEIRLPL